MRTISQFHGVSHYLQTQLTPKAQALPFGQVKSTDSFEKVMPQSLQSSEVKFGRNDDGSHRVRNAFLCTGLGVATLVGSFQVAEKLAEGDKLSHHASATAPSESAPSKSDPSTSDSTESTGTPDIGKAKDVKVTGTNYYVDSVHGSDSNDGLSQDKPLKSLDRVNQLDLKPGDGVNFAKGSTFRGELDVKNSGTEDKPIVYRAYGAGDAPVFENPGGDWTIAISVTGSHNVLDGLKMQNATVGVQFANGGEYNTLQNSEATKVGRGVDTEGDNNAVISNKFYNLKMVVNTKGGGDDNGANGVVVHSSGIMIKDNWFKDNKAPSYDYGQDGGALEIYVEGKDRPVNHTVFKGNTVLDSDGVVEVGAADGAGVYDTLIDSNTLTNNAGLVINIHMGNGSDPDNTDVKKFIVKGNIITDKFSSPDQLFIGGTIKDNVYKKLQ